MARHLWLQIYLTIKAPFVLKVFQNGACLSHTSRVKFFCQLCVIPSVYTHHSAADSQWVYLKFVGLAIDMLNMKYLTFPCEHILKRHGLLFLVCKYFIITVFVTTSCDGLKVEKNRIVLRTRSAYLCFVCLTLLPNRYFPLFGLHGNGLCLPFLQPQIIRSCDAPSCCKLHYVV